jgi:hypothetical protein
MRLLCAGLLALLASACQHHTAMPERSQPEPKVLYGGSHCGYGAPRPAAQWIGSTEQLRALYERFAGRAPAAAVAGIDFAKEGVLLIEMGERPTAGYALDLPPDAARIKDGRLELIVDWTEPPPDAITAQVITSPCLLVRLPRAGYREVRVIDQEGSVRAEVQVP